MEGEREGGRDGGGGEAIVLLSVQCHDGTLLPYALPRFQGGYLACASKTRHLLRTLANS